MARRIRLVAFDLDGTLVDSHRDLVDAVNALLAERARRPLDAGRVAGMIGSGARRLVERACEAAGLDVPTEADHRRFLALYDRRLLHHTRVYDGVMGVLDLLARQGRRLVVLTNKPLAPSRRILDGLMPPDRFAAVVGGDDPAGRKPDPTTLHRLMRDAGVGRQDTLLVGDSRVDLETARNAGVAICLVRYGFGYASVAPATLGPDEHVADVPAGIARVIARLERP